MGTNNNATTKVIEKELAKVEDDKYKSLFVASRDAVMTLEPPSWKFTSANPATVLMFGAKSEEDFLQYPPWELSPKLQADGSESMGKAMEMIEKAMEKGSNLFEWTHKRVNGDEFSAEVLLSRVEEKGKTYLHAVVRDITNRKKLEKEIEENSEEKFRIIFENTNDGMVLAETESKKFVVVNPAMCKMLGYTQNEMIKLCVSDIHPQESLAHVFEQFEKQEKGELKIAKDLPVKRKDGSIFYADVSASPVMVGNKHYLLGIFRDVTDHMEWEEKVQKKVEELEQLNRFMVGRELKMIELKKDLEEMKNSKEQK